MKTTLLTGWHLIRWVRLVFGIFIGIQAIQTHDIISGLLAGFFLYQAVTNTGCCGVSACAVPVSKPNKTEDVEFEEIKTK